MGIPTISELGIAANKASDVHKHNGGTHLIAKYRANLNYRIKHREKTDVMSRYT